MMQFGRGSVLVTGAAGYLGGLLRKGLEHVSQRAVLTDIKPLPNETASTEVFFQENLSDLQCLPAIACDVDTIVHLGGMPVEAPWSAILDANVVGTCNVFEAGRLATVKRIIYASSHHVVGFYRRTRVVDPEVPPRPDSRYAVSKVFGEALGRLYADKYGMDMICLRIGVVRPKPPNVRALSAWLSECDFVRLCLSAISAPRGHYRVVYGVSDNETLFWRDSAWEEIGFGPKDSAAAFLNGEEQRALRDDESDVEQMFQGGWFCGMEFSGDSARVD